MRLHFRELVMLTACIACQAAPPPLEVVEEVDLESYAGSWYEIASFPQRFQQGCVATKATYTRREDGRIRVENECRDKSFDGDLRRIEGVAWLTDPSTSQAKLKVRFFWPFTGNYWILELDPEYQYAVVGAPSRKYLWILSRTRTIEPSLYQTLLSRIEAHGFDRSRLQLTRQPPSP